MYEAFFGLSSRPFAEHADADFFVDSERHASALRALHDGISSHHPIFVITGETGCGKTMLVRRLMRDLSAATTIGFITSTHPSVNDLAPWALLSFGLDVSGLGDQEFHEALSLFVISEYAEGRRCLLVIDEAQNLSPAALEGLHRHLDLNSAGDCLLQVVLVAQPPLLQTMRDPTLSAWAERTPLVCFAGALPLQDVGTYVRARLAIAGAPEEIFTERAIAAVAAASAGIPRLINATCDLALTCALALKRSRVDRDLIAEVISEGRSAGFGSLAMLEPIDPAEAIEAPVGEAACEHLMLALPVAVGQTSITASAVLAEAAALPEIRSVDLIYDKTMSPDTFTVEEEMSEILPAVAQETAELEPVAPHLAPDTSGHSFDPEVVPDPQVVAWPSVSGRNDFAPPRRGAGLKTTPIPAGQSLRRRFLPLA